MMDTTGDDLRNKAIAVGWLFSCVLHGSLVLGSLLFVQKVQLAPQPEPFKWNVAMVSPERVVNPAPPAPLPPTPIAKPAAAAPVQPPVSPEQARTSEPQIVKPVITPPSPPQQKNPAMPSMAPPAPPVAPVQQAQTSEPTPAPIVKPVESQAVVPRRPELPPQTPIQEHKPEPVPPQPIHAQPAEQVMEQVAPVPQQIVEPAPAPVDTPAPVHQQMEPAAAVQPIAPPLQAEQLAPATAADRSQPHTDPQVASIAPPRPSAPTRVDYGWLSDTILKRVEELKRYPVEARGDRAEGKVIVKAVIKEDGTVGDVEVVRSSGFQSLDHAALELMRHAGPFNLPRTLGKPQVTVQIPLNYRLDRP